MNCLMKYGFPPPWYSLFELGSCAAVLLVLLPAAIAFCEEKEMMKDSVLVGVHFFAGWWEPLPNKWIVAGSDWRENYPSRVPLLGQYNTQETMDKEIQAAAAHGVDFFQILWYYNDADSEREPNSQLLNRGLEDFLQSPHSDRLKFLIEFCNHPPYQVETDEEWSNCLKIWVAAMRHPSYLRVGNRLVFKVHGGHYFIRQNGADLERCRTRLQSLRNAVQEAGLGEMLIGCGVGAHEQVSKDSRFAELFDFTNTYMDVPNCELTAEPHPYTVLANHINSGREKHRNDVIPYVPFVAAGWYPRPWRDPRPDFEFPTDTEWRQELSRMRSDLEAHRVFGLPLSDNSSQKVFTIYAWNEFGEGGFVAPTVGEKYQRLEAIRDVFGYQ